MLASKLASIAGYIGAALLAASIAAGATCAFAANLDDEVSINVSVAGLDMTSEAGAQEALARIRHAARRLCGDSGAKLSAADQLRFRSCVTDAIGRAVTAANRPTLTAASQGEYDAPMASAPR